MKCPNGCKLSIKLDWQLTIFSKEIILCFNHFKTAFGANLFRMKIDNKNYYRVIKCDSNIFLIDFDGKIEFCSARKKIKKQSDIQVGDFVSVETVGEGLVLDKILPRKNSLIRPNVANIDQLIIIAAPVPQIDYFLIDKLIINAHKQNLNIILCLNKSDITVSDYANLKSQFDKCVDEIICISAKNAELKKLNDILKGHLSCFAGQSAVGKSTITNALMKKDKQTVGELSAKSQKGKNTTTAAEIIVLDKDTYIIDTPGFTMIDIFDIDYRELDLYYPEYVEYSHECKFRRCTHTVEPDCKIRELAAENILNKDRYERYKLIYNELKSVKKY